MGQATRRSILLGICAAAALLGGCAGMQLGQKTERVVIQVSDDNPKTWGQAMNVVANLKRNYAKRGVESEIQVVAFGFGIHMLRDDAVVANRVRDVMKDGTRMVACENSMGAHKLTKDRMMENIAYSETGIIYIMEKQRAGWSVIRP
jgi:hypothetical protein